MSERLDDSDRDAECASRLVLLAAEAVALHTPLEEIAAYLEFFPRAVRSELYAHLSHERLRGLEIRWTDTHLAATEEDGAAGGDMEWSLEEETEREWQTRSGSGVAATAMGTSSSRSGRKRDFRQAFWEHRFRALLRARVSHQDQRGRPNEDGQENSSTAASNNGGGDPHSDTQRKDGDENADAASVTTTTLRLFHDVVRHLKLHGREVIPRNVELIFTLQRLRRFEVHHPEQQKTCWTSLISVIQKHPSLRELCFFHGKLSDAQLQQIRLALLARAAATCSAAAIAKFELVSVKIRPRGYRELTSLLQEYRQYLTDVRISSCIADFENDAMVASILASPSLKRLSLEHNDLEDDAFTGIGKRRAPIALTHLKLGNNAISVATLNGICTASLDGFLKLQQLELVNNTDIGDPGIHALAPMLATGVTASSTLTHLDLYNCNFGLEGAVNLLLALGGNTTLQSLNIGHNFFGSSFGDLLADFLETNDTLQALYLNYVGLGTAGCTERLRKALRSNASLTEISFGANRLRDDGVDVLFQALIERCGTKPYRFVDLSGNLLTGKGFSAIANTIERISEDHMRASKRQKLVNTPPFRKNQNSEDMLIRELSLLDNDFSQDCSEREETMVNVLHRRIDVVRTNPWVGKRNVYDDEV